MPRWRACWPGWSTSPWPRSSSPVVRAAIAWPRRSGSLPTNVWPKPASWTGSASGTGSTSYGSQPRSGPRLRGPDQVGWARLLDREDANLRAARAWCDEDRGRAGLGLAMAAGLWEFWHIRGRLREGADWLTDALARAEEPLAARAEALNGLGVIVSVSGDHPRGAPLFAESVAAYEAGR